MRSETGRQCTCRCGAVCGNDIIGQENWHRNYKDGRQSASLLGSPRVIFFLSIVGLLLITNWLLWPLDSSFHAIVIFNATFD